MGLGALPIRDALYALPHQGDCLEDLAWLRQDLIKDGGDAIICTAALISGATDESLTDAFNQDRATMYAEITRLAREVGREGAPAGAKKLRRMLKNVVEIDYFQVEARAEAEAAIRELDMRMTVPAESARPATLERGRTWVTRAGVKVDRISSAWLIRRFIDPEAEIRFVDPATYEHAAGELRFDMFDGEYTHRGDYCTFETLVAHFALHDSALRALAEIIHDIDVKDSKFERAETAGVAAFIDGLVRAEPDDEIRLERGFVLFDSLYESLSARA